MLTERELDRLCVVLVRARNPSNIGAAARAMHDFGFSRLRVVNEFAPPLEGARAAVDASEVLAGAQVYATVAEAVADCTLVIGTTSVGERNLQHELLPLAEAGVRILAELRRPPTHDHESVMNGAPDAVAGRVALLFGSEKTGLSNEELSHCNWLMTIPMRQHEGVRHPSMNLGQAVGVCLYELVRDELEIDRVTNSAQPAAAEILERLSARLSEVLGKTEYTRRHPVTLDPAEVRRLVRRMGLNADDAKIWMGILRQVMWKMGEE